MCGKSPMSHDLWKNPTWNESPTWKMFMLYRVAKMHRSGFLALSCGVLSAKEPLIIRLFCRKWRIKIRHPMSPCHPVRALRDSLLDTDTTIGIGLFPRPMCVSSREQRRRNMCISPQNSPMFPQKSPVSLQKTTVSPQKSPCTCQVVTVGGRTSSYTCIHTHTQSCTRTHSRQRALYLHKKNPYRRERASFH